MSAKASYFKIGVFVISAVAIAVIAVIVLGASALFRKKVMAETYIDGSVQGLEVGSPVKFRGVQIGNVEDISFVDLEYDFKAGSPDFLQYGRYVMVKMALEPGEVSGDPERFHSVLQREIAQGLRVRLAAQGVTGTAYLEVDYLDPKPNPPLKIGWKPRSYYVPSAPSTITRLTDSLDRILSNLKELDLQGITEGLKESLNVVTKVIEDANVKGIGEQVEDLLTDIDKMIEKGEIKSILTDASATMASFRRTVEGSEKPLAQVLADLPEASGSIESLAKKLDAASDDLPETMTRLRGIVCQLDELVSSQRPNIQRTLENMRAISQNVRDLSERAKQDPSSIFFGKPPPKSKRRKK